MLDPKSAAKTDRPVLCLVVDRSCSKLPFCAAVEAAVAGGVDWVQVRDRGIESAELLSIARDITAAAERGANGRRVSIIVNRRVDIALATNAAGVHLGFDAMSPSVARALLPDGALLGCSAHTANEVNDAANAGVDYAHIAPIFAPLSKSPTRSALGIDGLADAANQGLWVLAQGGIETKHCADVLAAGAKGIAVTGSILMSEDPGGAAAALREALDSHPGHC